MSNVAYVFLDANILLHFQPPDQMDWSALCRAERVNLVVYPLLMTELTKAKDEHPRRNLRDRASVREVWVRERLSRLETPVRPGVFLTRDTKEPRSLARELDLDWQHRDDRIIAHAVSYARQGRRTFVMTNDGGLELKLPDFDIHALVPDQSLRLASEPDPEKLRADRAENALREVTNRLPKLVIASPMPIALPLPPMTETEEEFIQRQLAKAQGAYEQYQRGLYGHGRPLQAGFDTIDTPRNAAHFTQAKSYLATYYRWLDRIDGAQQTTLTVENIGTSPATNVRLRLQTPSFLGILDRRSIGPAPSRPPMLSVVFAGIQPEAPVSISGQNLFFYDPNAKRFAIAADLHGAEYAFERIPHQDRAITPEIYLVADRDSPPGNTAVSVSILCDEVGLPQTSFIPIRVFEL